MEWIVLAGIVLLVAGAAAYVKGTEGPGTTLSPSRFKTPWDDIFDKYGAQYGVDSNLLRAIAKQESGPYWGKPIPDRIEKNGTRSIGVMQVLDATARSLGVSISELRVPDSNIGTAARLLVALKKELGTYYTWDRWISSYNEGSPNVLKYGIKNQSYVDAVKRFYSEFSS